MSYDPHDTICAVATAPGGAARGIVRVSGQGAIEVVDRLFRVDQDVALNHFQSAAAVAGWVILPHRVAAHAAGSVFRLPCDLFLWPTARSYTREPVAEFHTFGSPPLLEALTSAICQAGARLAEPGEFTLRAFLAGRIDLTQAEAVLGVIDAHGESELSAALAQLAGGLARPLQSLRDDLLQLLAELEAGLDFVDEDIEFVSLHEVRDRLASARKLLDDVSRQMASRSTGGAMAQVALVGRPNVGKSSLFNALVQRHGGCRGAEQVTRRPALVSTRRGTTRDYLTAIIDLDGIRVELVDTAGIDEDVDAAESSSIDKAAQVLAADRRAGATIRLHCVELANESSADAVCHGPNEILVVTKIDLAERAQPVFRRGAQNVDAVCTSSRTGDGLDQLTAAVREAICCESAASGQVVGATADRCRESIRLAAAALDRAGNVLEAAGGQELVAAEIRISLGELGKVVGVVYTDDLLDRIFSTFCIGK
jgi:tRNA modification GTPase